MYRYFVVVLSNGADLLDRFKSVYNHPGHVSNFCGVKKLMLRVGIDAEKPRQYGRAIRNMVRGKLGVSTVRAVSVISMDSKKCAQGDISALSRAINYLGLLLYQELAKEQENVFFSPLSLSSSLSMLFCGAGDCTLSEMRKVLGFEMTEIPDDQVKNCFQHLLSDLNKMPNSYKLTTSNAMIINKKFSIKDKFKKILSKYFEALISEVDFQKDSSRAAQTVNNWVKRKTNGVIPKLLESLDPDAVMVLLNAVYFKGYWVHRFKRTLTFGQTFYNKGMENNGKEVQMMHQKESFLFADREEYKALQLPYKGGKIAMLILLPNDCSGLGELDHKLSSDFIEELQAHMHELCVNVSLPRFRLDCSKPMKDYLKSLGMKTAFGNGANFDGISESGDLFVSKIVHKAFVEVNEIGTEAAASTGCETFATSYEPIPEFVVDHPFLFLIYNTKSNLILFIGRVDEL